MGFEPMTLSGNTIVAIWRENMLGYLSADIICSEKRTVFRERSSRKTVSYEEQLMSRNKYPSIFSPQMGTLYFVFIILQIFFATRAIFKIGEYLRNRKHVPCLYRVIQTRVEVWKNCSQCLNKILSPRKNAKIGYK